MLRTPIVAASWILAALLAAANLPAQGRVWTVDAQNGAGTDFTDLPPAIVAAVDGDLIRVRPGLYHSVSIVNKALTILGGPGVQTWLPSQPLSVLHLAAGKQVVLAGIDHRGASSTLVLSLNQGRVILDRMALAAVAVTDCPSVQLNDCTLQGRQGGFGNPSVPALQVTRSTVVVSACMLRGAHTSSPLLPSTGLLATTATVTLARSVVAGGAGGEVAPNMPGIMTSASTLTISGDAAAVVESGQSVGAAAAIVTSGGSLTIDANVTLRGFQSAPITGTAAVHFTLLPSLRATGAAPGGVATADVYSRAADLLVFVASLAADPIDLGPTGVLWLDPSLLLFTGFAVQGASGHTTIPTSVPNDPSLRFHAWSQQVLSGTPLNGFRLSNPATFSFH